MILKLVTFLFFLSICDGFENSSDWDLAVATDGRIELLLSNGTRIGASNDGFTKVKALSFDAIRHQFLVSDMDEYNNDTIYAIDLTKETNNDPIIADLPDDVQGLAVDPIDDVLYWTDSKNRSISSLILNEEDPQIRTLFVFKEAIPQDITIDVCRRYIYWTNSFRRKPTIERAKIGSSVSEVIVSSDLGMPAGITIDYRTRRIYWADIRGGIYYRIESTNLEGKERQVVYEGTHAEPFSIAIKDEYLYFTDLRRNALWKLYLPETTQPLKIANFEETPMGLIAKKREIRKLPDCQLLEEAYQNYTKSENELLDRLKINNTMPRDIECVNGVLQDGVCKCVRGYSGVYCELSLCHNFCLFGSCHFTKHGYPFCHCPRGMGGTRCEKDCTGYCMNDGVCRFSYPNAKFPSCTCPEGFVGDRCEISVITKELCDSFCNDNSIGRHVNEAATLYCKCDNTKTANLVEDHSESLPVIADNSSNYFSYFRDPVFITMGGVTVFALIVCVILSISVLYLRRKPTPRIKRRYIVNKNPSTSLTERPQHPEQCEITIENCCNMNICETPCFEPSRLHSYHQGKSDDKKKLLSNMERSEDQY